MYAPHIRLTSPHLFSSFAFALCDPGRRVALTRNTGRRKPLNHLVSARWEREVFIDKSGVMF